MKKRLFLTALGVAGLVCAQAPQQSASPQKAVVTQYCQVCHNDKLKTGGLTLEKLNPDNVSENSETWEKVVRKLRAGMMPPSGMRRPAPEALESFIVTLETQLDKAEKPSLPPPGLHRLNRTEYSNVIRDLLGLEIDASKFLPADDSTRGFDNVAAA